MATKTDQLSVGELAAAVVAADPDLQDQLKTLMNDIIGHMRHTMAWGDTGAKTALAKTVLPQLLSAMTKVDSSQRNQEQREAYERMMNEWRGGVPK